MRPSRGFIAALFCATLTFVPAPASATDAAPVSKKQGDKKARELYLAGDKAYAEGRYEEALEAFQKAYELSGRPGLLYNMGNALERLGRSAEAASALDEYLPHAKPSEKEIIEKRVENLKKRAEAEAEKARAHSERKPPDEPVKPAPPAPAPVEPERESPTLGYVLVGAGGVAIAVGVVAGVLALGARSDADAGCTESGGKRLCSAEARDAIDRDQTLSLVADVGFVVGVVAASVGVYLLLDSGDEKEPATAHRTGIRTTARPGGGELQLVTTF